MLILNLNITGEQPCPLFIDFNDRGIITDIDQ